MRCDLSRTPRRSHLRVGSVKCPLSITTLLQRHTRRRSELHLERLHTFSSCLRAESGIFPAAYRAMTSSRFCLDCSTCVNGLNVENVHTRGSGFSRWYEVRSL